MILIILPNQLFDIKYIPKYINEIIIWEHSNYFIKYKFNRLKLILHRSSMRLYFFKLSKKYNNIKYINYFEKLYISDKKKYYIFKPSDKIKLPKKIIIIDNPNHLLNSVMHDNYFHNTQKFHFNHFYMYFKRELNILQNIKSTDKENRKTIPKEEIKKIPLKENNIFFSKKNIIFLDEAIEYIKKHFYDNYGPDWKTIKNNWDIPIDINDSKKKWKWFINCKSKNFAIYQDYILFDEKYGNEIYHSGISSSLNIGLLQPNELINDILKIKNINSKEAFIRQLFWREYQLYCYNYCKEFNDTTKSYFNTKKKLTKDFYEATTKIYPLDFCIKKAFNYGYLQHIERLMVVGNFMLLYGINHNEGFKWFMEFSIDSYEWVMFQNVYDMIFNITGGKTMKRIYISSSNYIIKMSNLTISSSISWKNKWDILFFNFLKKYKKKIGYPYNLSIIIK